jgi:hypothetical protein
MAALATIPSKPEAEPSGYFRVAEAARIRKVGERWLRDGFNHHGFPGARMNGYLVFSGADLAQIYERFRTPGFTTVRRPPARRRRTAAA